ncbi:hypothetical protein SNE40_008271 [Patella caerulea]|uniref:Uncharacterized protein n=1 Tax=Patella caerulea TaxID=87958 RepID=A0AAN8K596_PATCE
MAKDQDERRQVETIIKERGMVALYIAAFRDLYEMCVTLLKIGVSPNGRTPFGRSPLHAAASKDNDAILDLLVQARADLDLKDAGGETALLLARSASAKLCSRKLRLYNLDKNGLRPINGMVKNIKVNMPGDQKFQNKNDKNEATPVHLPKPPTDRREGLQKVGKVRDTRQGELSGRSSSQCFVWDIEDDARKQLASQLRVQTAVNTKRNAVRWKDAPSLIEIRRHPPNLRGKSATYPNPILKNTTYSDNTEKRNNLIRTLSRESLESNSSTIKSEAAPSQPDSEMTLMSAPGEGHQLNNNFDARSVESAPAMTSSEPTKVSSLKGSREKGSVRLLPFRRKQNEGPASRAKRHIRIAENQKHKYQPKENSESFDEWLEKKRLQECRERLRSRSDEGSQGSDSEDGKSTAYDDWLRKRGHRKLNEQREMTVEELYRWNDRPLRSVVMIGQSQVEDKDTIPQTPETNLRVYQNWKQKRPKPRQRHVDTETQKKELEKKRQQLLAAAVTYDDWLDHTEEKKLLMKQILKANMEELEKIEEENIKKRSPRQISFQKWNAQVQKREMTDRKKMEEERMFQDALRAEQMRSSACVTHDLWLQKKREEIKLKQTVNKNDATTKQRVQNKPLNGTTKLEDITKGRELLQLLRDKRRGSAVAS